MVNGFIKPRTAPYTPEVTSILSWVSDQIFDPPEEVVYNRKVIL
jgi:hypothetical protein